MKRSIRLQYNAPVTLTFFFLSLASLVSVSYTHLDVYKRQANAFGPARNQSGTAQVFGLRHGQAPFMVRSSCCSCAAVSTG